MNSVGEIYSPGSLLGDEVTLWETVTGKQILNQAMGHRLVHQEVQRQEEIEPSVLRVHRYLSKSFKFFGEGHSSWKLAQAHTLAWLSTRYFRWECTCRAITAMCELWREGFRFLPLKTLEDRTDRHRASGLPLNFKWQRTPCMKMRLLCLENRAQK
jgi:hypothetical protein